MPHTKCYDDEGCALPTTDELIALFSGKLPEQFLDSLKGMDPLSAFYYTYKELSDVMPSTEVERILIAMGLINADPNFPVRVLSGEHV